MIIQSFQLFESSSNIDKICQKYHISNYVVNSDGSIDVSGDVNLNGMNLTKLPLKFGHVGGYFSCSNNQLTSLEWCPQSIGGNFYCSNNQLTSLKGCPESIGDGFYCNNNQLTSLEGCPESVGGDFDCHNNQLTSLKGCPTSVGGNFNCSRNQLISLKGSPRSVGGDFYCYDNKLTSLKGCPTSVGESFYCSYNQIKDFGNKYFKSQDFDCYGNPIEEIYNLNPCKEFIEYLIEYQVIRDGNKIIKQRLIQSLEDSNWKEKEFKFKNYELI